MSKCRCSLWWGIRCILEYLQFDCMKYITPDAIDCLTIWTTTNGLTDWSIDWPTGWRFYDDWSIDWLVR
jgi:hypothetical protein